MTDPGAYLGRIQGAAYVDKEGEADMGEPRLFVSYLPLLSAPLACCVCM